MKTVVLITCTKSKHKGTHKAEYLYSMSNNFVKYLESAKLLADYQDIYVISALHELIPLDKEIECYDYTLKDKSDEENDTWGKNVTEQLESLYKFSDTQFIVLADDDYSSALKPYLPNIEVPLEGIGCGPGGYNQLDDYVCRFIKTRNSIINQ